MIHPAEKNAIPSTSTTKSFRCSASIAGSDALPRGKSVTNAAIRRVNESYSAPSSYLSAGHRQPIRRELERQPLSEWRRQVRTP